MAARVISESAAVDQLFTEEMKGEGGGEVGMETAMAGLPDAIVNPLPTSSYRRISSKVVRMFSVGIRWTDRLRRTRIDEDLDGWVTVQVDPEIDDPSTSNWAVEVGYRSIRHLRGRGGRDCGRR